MSRLNLTEPIDKADDKILYLPKASRSVSNHGRNTSGTRARSKIPMIVTQNTAADTSQMSPAKEMTSPPSVWGNRSRMTSRSFNSSPSKTRASSFSAANQRILERQYKNKQNRYMSIRNEIQEKQLSALNIYEEVSQLREKIMAVGGKDPGKIESIKSISGDFSVKINENYNNNDNNNNNNNNRGSATINSSINKEFASTLLNELEDYPKGCLTLCEDAINKHSELIKSIDNLKLNHNEDKLGEFFLKQLDDWKTETESFKVRLEMTKKSIEESKSEMTNKVKAMWEEIDCSRFKIRELETMSNEVVDKLRKKIEAEAEKFNQLKETKDVTDNDLRKTKAVVQELEARIQSDEINIIKSQEYVKSLKSELHQNDKIFENRTRDLNNSLKNAEETIENLENQRSELEASLIELQDKLEEVQLERDEAIQEARKRIEEDEEFYKSSQVEKLNCEIASLNKELITCKDFISGINDRKLSSDRDLECQLEEERARIKDLTQDYQSLQRTFETTQARMIDLEQQVASMYGGDLKDVPKDGFQALEVLKINEELGQEIADLRRKNIELDSSLAEAVNKFHQRDQQVHEQAAQIRVLDQMIVYLKNKTHGISDDQEVTKEISTNTEAIQKLYEMVDTKELQLTRLEKLVKQMEDQEERAQEQRTRLERRIAQLELALQTKNNKDPRYADYSIYEQVFQAVPSSPRFLDPQPKPRTPEYVYNTRLVQEEVARTLELERKYQKYKQKSQHIECFYNWMLERSPNFGDLNTSEDYHSRNRYPNPTVPHIDVSSYAYQERFQCGLL
ncbi:Protein of unknown function [Cotesia congregata]|uniref:Uncharacterized protein n=1 Tax=Cotesia congregata TaxID=51543 RepID=A0A8J2EDP3_COTCN|nr:Protein of unknown function [Cotesia congregata]